MYFSPEIKPQTLKLFPCRHFKVLITLNKRSNSYPTPQSPLSPSSSSPIPPLNAFPLHPPPSTLPPHLNLRRQWLPLSPSGFPPRPRLRVRLRRLLPHLRYRVPSGSGLRGNPKVLGGRQARTGKPTRGDIRTGIGGILPHLRGGDRRTGEVWGGDERGGLLVLLIPLHSNNTTLTLYPP